MSLRSERPVDTEEELRRARRRAEQAEERFEIATRGAKVGIWELNLQTGEVWRSLSHDLLYGYERPLPSWSLDIALAHMVEEDQAHVVEALERACKTPGDHRWQFGVIRADGTEGWLMVNAQTLTDQAGNLTKTIGVTTDVTEQRAWELKLARAIRAREETLAIVSHDLRTPLSSIVTLAALMERRLAAGTSPASTLDQVQRIRRYGEHMNRLIEDLLDLARFETGRYVLKREEVPAAALVDDAIDMMQPLAAERSIRLEKEPPLRDFTFRADRDQLMRVFSNLLGNAVKFSPHGGEVVVSARQQGRVASFSVRDFGPGISEQELPHVFHSYWQSEQTGKQQLGAGLGLAIAKGIVEAHGGHIWAESRAGEGATFRLELPIAPPPDSRAPRP